MPANAALTVVEKAHIRWGPMSPNLDAKRTGIPPPAPAMTVFAITCATVAPSPAWATVPKVPPLKARNPVMRIIAPIPTS